MGTTKMRAACFCLFLGTVALTWSAKVEFPQTTSFSLALRVDKSDWLQAQKEWKAVLDFVREKKMTSNTVMLVRTASEKIDKTLTEFAKIKAEKEAHAAREKALGQRSRPIAIGRHKRKRKQAS